MLPSEEESLKKSMKVLRTGVNDILKKLDVMHRVMVDGEKREPSWFSLPRPKCNQVDAVVKYMRLHPGHSVARSVKAAFAPIAEGFTFVALKTYVYRHKPYLEI